MVKAPSFIPSLVSLNGACMTAVDSLLKLLLVKVPALSKTVVFAKSTLAQL